jgi:ParB family chromosome partitioning protein
VWIRIGDLKPWDRNPRRNDAAVESVKNSIKRFGFGSPILARKADGEVIAGHTRLKAAQELGLEKVPVRYLDLDPADAHLLALADNKLGEISEWDDAVLLDILGDLRQQDSDAALVAGWDDVKIDALLLEAGNAVLAMDIEDAFGALPSGDKQPFQQMTFSLHDSQAAIVSQALERAKECGLAEADLNKNSNGNALAAICEKFLG